MPRPHGHDDEDRPMTIFDHIDRALRHLREGQRVRQYQVAEEAGITKAMLSAYETGKQKPSLETLDKILLALRCDLVDLHEALAVFQSTSPGPGPQRRTQRPAPRTDAAVLGPRRGSWSRGSQRRSRSSGSDTSRDLRDSQDSDVYATLGIREPLDRDEEEALGDVLTSFHKLIRHIHESSHRKLDDDDEQLGSPPGRLDQKPT